METEPWGPEERDRTLCGVACGNAASRGEDAEMRCLVHGKSWCSAVGHEAR